MLARDSVEVREYNKHYEEKSNAEKRDDGVRRLFFPGCSFDLADMVARRGDEVTRS
jgi:hypothetical protein